MKIDYITAHDPRDIKSWSGLNYFIMKALENQGAIINIITGLSAQPDFGLKWRWHWYRWHGKNYQYERSHCYTRQFGEQVNSQLSDDADLVFSTMPAALPYIKTTKPLVLYADSTFDNLAEYYDHFSKLPGSSKKMADKLEKLAFSKCALLVFASDWAAQSAIEFYKASPAKVKVVPFGANMIDPPPRDAILQRIAKKQMNEVVFLFVGVEFDRKGGEKAVAIVGELINQGINAKLVMVGMKDLASRSLPGYVTDMGFLNKNISAEKEVLEQLYENAHFFLMPVLKECYGVAFVEANAYGLPCLTTDISGIRTIIINGVNGFRFALNAPVNEYVSQVHSLLEDVVVYRTLAKSARMEYDKRLNWRVAGENIYKSLQTLVN